MLSYQARPWPHRGQLERGLTTDALAGHRRMQTFKNDPTQAPSINAIPNAPALIGRARRGAPLRPLRR